MSEKAKGGSGTKKTKDQKLVEVESKIRFKKIPNSKFDLLKIQFKIDGIEQRIKHLDDRLAALDNMEYSK